MANWYSNRLLIEGPNVDLPLDACGFLREVPESDGPNCFSLMNVRALDADVAKEEVVICLPESALQEDIFERTKSIVRFRFYTKWVPALNTIAVLADRFPDHRLSLLAVDVGGWAPLPMAEEIPGAVLVLQGEEEIYFNPKELLYGADGWVVFRDRQLPERIPSLRRLERDYTDELAAEIQAASSLYDRPEAQDEQSAVVPRQVSEDQRNSSASSTPRSLDGRGYPELVEPLKKDLPLLGGVELPP